MPRRLLLEGSAIEPLLRAARAEHGQSARVVKAEKVRAGGVGGFFAKERYEVTVEVDDEADGDDVRAPDDARSITEDLAVAERDPDQVAAPEAVRRALDVLGTVDDTPEIAAEIAAEAGGGGDAPSEAARPEPPSVEETVAMLQELPSSLALPPVPAGGTDPVDHPMTRRERRIAEAAVVPDAVVPDDDPGSPDGPDGPDDPDDPGSPGRPGPVQQARRDRPPPLPTTLAGLGEPEPGEALPELPSVRAALAAPAMPARPVVPATPAADLGSVADRLERLGIDRRWLHDVPDDLSPALRQLARRLAASPPRPRRPVQAADNPVLAVLAEDAGGLDTARALAVGLGLRADEVTVATSAGAAGTRPRAGSAPHRRTGTPLDRAAAARVAHGGRRRSAPSVVLVPVSFAASPAERTAAAAVMASLDADQVWAVVDATRRTSDVEGWLRAVGPSSGVDAVALVGTGSTTAPAASLRLSAPVVLLDGRPATAVDWVVHLAAHLVREDLEDHLGPHDRHPDGPGAGSPGGGAS